MNWAEEVEEDLEAEWLDMRVKKPKVPPGDAEGAGKKQQGPLEDTKDPGTNSGLSIKLAEPKSKLTPGDALALVGNNALPASDSWTLKPASKNGEPPAASDAPLAEATNRKARLQSSKTEVPGREDKSHTRLSVKGATGTDMGTMDSDPSTWEINEAATDFMAGNTMLPAADPNLPTMTDSPEAWEPTVSMPPIAVIDAFFMADDLRLLENELNYMESRLHFWSARLATYRNRPSAPRTRREVVLGRTDAVLHRLADLTVQVGRIPIWRESGDGRDSGTHEGNG
jgi:hypothetical protein